MLNTRTIALLAAIFTAAAMRLLPHPPNFSPIAAMALFSGAYFSRRGMAFVAPLAAMLVSDAILGFHALMPVVYGSLALVVCLGWLLSSRRTPGRVAGAAVAGSVTFYLVTNFAVWALGDMYPKTLEGLAACYVAALPFFQNGLAGDLFFTALLFGGFALAERGVPALRPKSGLTAA